MKPKDTQNPPSGAPSARVLVVDQGRRLYDQIQRVLPADAEPPVHVPDLSRVLELFESQTFDVLALSGSGAQGARINGLEVLEIISAKAPATQILFFINPDEARLAMSALRVGVYQYAKMPIGDEEMRLLIETALARRPRLAQNLLLKRDQPARFEDMVGGSPAMHQVYEQIRQSAQADIPVLITGETGTGKDLVARAIHQLSPRSDKPLLPIHLGALPEELVASELFGHERGAFTGALKRYEGSFEKARGGTVFLDEISTIDERVQISLLRLLETQTFQRIGGHDNIEADARVLAATNEDLYTAVERGSFREDLYYRLEVYHIHLPPVRERVGDVPLLVHHFLDTLAAAYQKHIKGISADCMTLLTTYDWPGNVRELKNVIHRVVVMCGESQVEPRHLPERIRGDADHGASIAIPMGASLEEAEREIIVRTLEHANNNRSRAADILGISRRSLYNKIAKYGL